MNKLLKILFSPRTTLGLLVLFAIAMAAATFIENSYDTETSKVIVYNAWWFELLMVFMVINFIGSIKRYQLLTWKKMAGFVFHFAFVIMIVGAGLTRYIGYEGTMHIREGASSDFIYSRDVYLTAKLNEDGKISGKEKPVLIGLIGSNAFTLPVETADGVAKISYNGFIGNVRESYQEGSSGGFPLLSIEVTDNGHKHSFDLKEGQSVDLHNIPFSFNNPEQVGGIHVSGTAENLSISYDGTIESVRGSDNSIVTIPSDSIGKFQMNWRYDIAGTGLSIEMSRFYKHTQIKYVPGGADYNGPNALFVNVKYKGQNEELAILGGAGYVDNFIRVPMEGIDLELAYGMKKIPLNFSLQLRDFQLDRYAGSMSPSSYASEVTLVDPNKGIREDHRIYMNNVLDYDGYRFFQSSYDKDEMGTVLSVNHDRAGTLVTYVGYALMILGFIWTLFNPHSRYWDLMSRIRQLRERRKNLTIMLVFLMCSASLFGMQQPPTNDSQINRFSVSSDHAEKFGELIVQLYEGRFAPVHTLASDVMLKISRKNKFDIPGRGIMSAMQVFLDIPLNVEFWRNQKIIYVREEAVREELGTDEKHIAFVDFFNEKGEYKLRDQAEIAFRKPDAQRNKFDKELIKVNERLEVFMMTYNGAMLDIFPVQNSENNKWVSWEDGLALQELQGSLRIINDDLQLEQLNYHNVMRTYFMSLASATRTADYSKAEKILGYLSSMQRQSDARDLIPSEKKIKSEISYNKSNIFITLKNLYGVLSMLLLFLAFVDNLKSKKNKILTWMLHICTAVLALGFLYHTYGMGMRWYLSGHAPWSNGYEALILVAWASLLAGFSFMRYSKITLAATSLLAFFTLMTASHSSYDPQLTNLQPVLKSYWLIIHVATLTISYGFLGLGFVLGFFNMGIYIFKNKKNGQRLSLITRELTYINEMNLTIGLLLATVGTFLGGVWANESWGRYWGWDAKETWALIITVVYTIILHMRLAPKIKGEFIFNVAAIFGFGSVLMTFIGVNYYFTKGMHSYASGDTPVFPMWAWITILAFILVIIVAGVRERKYNKQFE